jgi:hypothetical protein
MAKKPQRIVVHKTYYSGAIMTIKGINENRMHMMFGIKWCRPDLFSNVSESSVQSHKQVIYWIPNVPMCDPDPKIEQNLPELGMRILTASKMYLSSKRVLWPRSTR